MYLSNMVLDILIEEIAGRASNSRSSRGLVVWERHWKGVEVIEE